jgi:hypothetical protein
VKFTSKHSIPKNGKFRIEPTELWNNEAINNKEEYFSSITCDSFMVGTKEIPRETYHCSLLKDPVRVVVDGGFKQAAVP